MPTTLTVADFLSLRMQYKAEQAENEIPAVIEHNFKDGRMVDHYFVVPSPALLNNTDTETYDIQTYFDRLDHDAYKNDPALYQVGCPFCGKPLVLNDIWLKRGNTGYYTEATCPDHGPWFLRFKLNRRDGLHWNFARCIETVRPESYARYKKLEKSQRERIRMKTERAGKKTQE